jgi:hypothetical protein
MAGNNLWGNCQTNGTMAFGVSQPSTYGDPTAILTGTWGPNQTVQATVKINKTPTGNCCHEAEVRVRNTINSTTHQISGYEIYCSVLPTDPYCHIARWNGTNGSYCNIEDSAPHVYLVNGDVLTAAVTGTNPVIVKGYVNNVEIMSATDTGQNCSPGGAAGPFTTGSPGIGFFDDQDNWTYFGFSSFTATGSAPPPSSNYTLTALESGTGTGYVTSSPSGISCGSTCSSDYTSGAVVTLTATPDPGNSFTGWSGGGCSGTGACILNMSDDKSVTATFTSNSSPAPGDSGGSGGGCFIATAAYGSYIDPHVYVLRNFRDRYLLTNSLGQSFVNSYYRYSPPVADLIGKHESLKIAARWALTPVVCGVEHPYIAASMLLMIPAGIIMVLRKRKIKANHEKMVLSGPPSF